MRILIYNWASLDDEEKRGGGVSVYCRNLVAVLAEAGHEVFFLSAGNIYNLFSERKYIKPVPTKVHLKCRSFVFVNSSVLAPAAAEFTTGFDPAPDEEGGRVFRKFLRDQRIEVLHLNNLEGIPLSFLQRDPALKLRIVYSIHNYFAFCPQVNLWYDEQKNCLDFKMGRKCVSCNMGAHPRRQTLESYAFGCFLQKIGLSERTRFYKRVHRILTKNTKLFPISLLIKKYRKPSVSSPTHFSSEGVAAGYLRRRQVFVATINSHVDHVLAVSRRTRDLAEGFGIEARKLRTVYIGTRFQTGGKSRSLFLPDGTLKLVYLGWARHDKGFFFLMRALRSIPREWASRIRLVFGSHVKDAYVRHQLWSLSHRFKAVEVRNGYTHSDLPVLLENATLGVIPVLWEDNLPQVAFEMCSFGLSLLTSDLGGAKELGGCTEEFIFRAGDRADFVKKLTGLMQRPELVEKFWARRMKAPDMAQHVRELEAIYRQPGEKTKFSGRIKAITASEFRNSIKGNPVLQEDASLFAADQTISGKSAAPNPI